MEASYLKTFKSGALKARAEQLFQSLHDCTLCPRNCHADRISGDTGICETADRAVVSSFMPHFGEEFPISGVHGSGTIFFTNCNLLCNFCQNFDISHEGQGYEVGPMELARMMLSLQELGCHNINFVTPSHVVPQILQALIPAISNGLRIPLVYNSGGYDNVSTLKFLDGIFDIYMPDFKFWDFEFSQKTCNAPDYPEITKEALLEMHNQAGALIINKAGIAERGLLVRHLVMPGGLAGTGDIMKFLADDISQQTYVNIMPQYRPCGRSFEISEINRPISNAEFNYALEAARKAGLNRLDNV
jgi:putative pyruvate formate lyase activating enzyme